MQDPSKVPPPSKYAVPVSHTESHYSSYEGPSEGTSTVIKTTETVTSKPAETTITKPTENPPGKNKTLKKHLLEIGTETFQSFSPMKASNLHLCGFAFYNGHPERQVELHHYCTDINEEFTQCVIYDSDQSDAKLLGVEYIISSHLFNTLPAEEQMYWHSHQYDVRSGSLYAPRLPGLAENNVAKDVANTYGKTWVCWQVDRGDKLPLGPPQLMMVATKDGMWKEDLFTARAKKIRYKRDKVKQRREKIEYENVLPGADHWEKSTPLQTSMMPAPDARIEFREFT